MEEGMSSNTTGFGYCNRNRCAGCFQSLAWIVGYLAASVLLGAGLRIGSGTSVLVLTLEFHFTLVQYIPIGVQ